jgi:hypothetical protein
MTERAPSERDRPRRAHAATRTAPPAGRQTHRKPERARSEPVPGLVTVHLWQVPARRVPAAAVRVALDRTRERWYAEELFARFAVLRAAGTVDGRDPLG